MAPWGKPMNTTAPRAMRFHDSKLMEGLKDRHETTLFGRPNMSFETPRMNGSFGIGPHHFESETPPRTTAHEANELLTGQGLRHASEQHRALMWPVAQHGQRTLSIHTSTRLWGRVNVSGFPG